MRSQSFCVWSASQQIIHNKIPTQILNHFPVRAWSCAVTASLITLLSVYILFYFFFYSVSLWISALCGPCTVLVFSLGNASTAPVTPWESKWPTAKWGLIFGMKRSGCGWQLKICCHMYQPEPCSWKHHGWFTGAYFSACKPAGMCEPIYELLLLKVKSPGLLL